MNTCIIAANGKSLNDYNFEIVNQFPVFGLNRGYLKTEMSIDYLTVVNDLVISQFQDEIVDYCNRKGCILFAPGHLFNKVPILFRNINFRKDEPYFETRSWYPLWQGHTVTFVALQIAYWLGFEKVILIGLDHYYPDAKGKPSNHKEKLDKDNSHFTAEYFSGKYWHTPNLKMSEIAYKLALENYKKDSRVIINATPTTKLTVFPVMTLEEAVEWKS